MKFAIFFILTLMQISWSQFVPFSIWQQPAAGGAGPCGASPSIGDVCPGGAIYAGTFQGGEYMIVPGNCTDSATPTCDGDLENTMKAYRGSSGSNGDIPGVSNLASGSDPSSSSERGHVITPIIVASALISSDSAADYCNNMTYGGFDDWYLPSKSEMAYIYCKSTTLGHNTSKPEEDPNCVINGGKTSELPQNIMEWEAYWTATPNWAGSSYKQAWDGSQYIAGKGDNLYVKCIRRF